MPFSWGAEHHNVVSHRIASRSSRRSKLPLGFFVLVLVVEVVFGIVAGLREGPDRTYLVVGMICLMFFVVGIVAFLAYSGRDIGLLGRSGGSRYSLLVGPPEDMPDFDIAIIEWDEAECFIISTKIKERDLVNGKTLTFEELTKAS